MEFFNEEQFTLRVESDTKNGPVTSRTWLNADGQIHNPIAPARIEYCPNTGRVIEIAWMVYDKLDRSFHEGPALIEYDYENGTETHSYFVNDRLHRLNGPAIVTMDLQAKRVMSQLYFHEGIECSRNDITLDFDPF